MSDILLEISNFAAKVVKNLHISKKSSNFAGIIKYFVIIIRTIR